MNTIKCYITKRHNGLYLVTGLRPKMMTVIGTDHIDAYIRAGDPIGHTNISKTFMSSVCKSSTDKITTKPIKFVLSNEGKNTHYVMYNEYLKLYSIHSTNGSYIEYVCKWFVDKMFNIKELDSIQPVHFSGRLL